MTDSNKTPEQELPKEVAELLEGLEGTVAGIIGIREKKDDPEDVRNTFIVMLVQPLLVGETVNGGKALKVDHEKSIAAIAEHLVRGTAGEALDLMDGKHGFVRHAAEAIYTHFWITGGSSR